MKAKVIKTGEIVNVVPTEGGWAAVFENGVWHYTDSELDFEFADWADFRREAAKDILCALVSMPSIWEEYPIKSLAKSAIMQADELIKQLKEEKI